MFTDFKYFLQVLFMIQSDGIIKSLHIPAIRYSILVLYQSKNVTLFPILGKPTISKTLFSPTVFPLSPLLLIVLLVQQCRRFPLKGTLLVLVAELSLHSQPIATKTKLRVHQLWYAYCFLFFYNAVKIHQKVCHVYGKEFKPILLVS